jgi:hypothetical protein
MADELRITGLVETQQMLRDVPADIQAGIGAGMIAAGAVIQQELYRNAPRIQEGGKSEFQPLHSSLVTDVEINAEENYAVASTGFGDAGPVALWNEYGHRIVSRRGKDSGETTEPNPFMRRSTDNCAEDAIDAFCDRIRATVRQR